MDIFRFNNPNNPTKMEDGIFIKHLKSILWVERYREPGSFELTGRVSDDLMTQLPRGACISHIDTNEIMIVENHEIQDDGESDTLVKITGRSFETFLDQRVVLGNNAWVPLDYLLLANYTWHQTVKLISDHIINADAPHEDDNLQYIDVINEVLATIGSNTTPSEESIARVIKRGSLYQRVIELLSINDLGIKTVRPRRYYTATAPDNTGLIIYRGRDLSSDVIFSYETGEVKRANYLWSLKKLKNTASVSGKWVNVVVGSDETGYDRRIMQVDASDIDEGYSAYPTGSDLTDVQEAMTIRGQEALSKQNDIALMNAEPKSNSDVYIYRQDYNVGDVVTVRAEYEETKQVRVTEYIEVEDDTGFSGYPTFSNIEGNVDE